MDTKRTLSLVLNIKVTYYLMVKLFVAYLNHLVMNKDISDLALLDCSTHIVSNAR